MAKKKLELIKEIRGWGYTLDHVNSVFEDVTKDDTVMIPINSYGGSVMEGTAVYNVIKGSKAKTEAHILGYAMSMGTIVALAADEVIMPENGFWMIHEPSMVEWGDAQDHQDVSHLLDIIGMDAAKIYADKTGMSVKKIRAMMKKTTWLNAKQALEMGFVDRLSPATEIHASLDPQKFKNAPAELLANLPGDSKDDKDANGLMGQMMQLIKMALGTGSQKTESNSELDQTKDQLSKATSLLESAMNKMADMNKEIATQKSRIAELEKNPNGKHISGSEIDDEDENPNMNRAYLKGGLTAKMIERHKNRTITSEDED